MQPLVCGYYTDWDLTETNFTNTPVGDLAVSAKHSLAFHRS